MTKCYVLIKERQWKPIFGPVVKGEACRVFMDEKEAKAAAKMLNEKARDYWYSVKRLPLYL